MPSTILRGITWGHSRGITPLLAVSQRYTELHPDIEIQWKKRSLQEFADMPVEALAKEYDLLIIDHPWVGAVAELQCLLPLNEYLPADYWQDQSANSVGDSHSSYYYQHRQWALAIDAATPAASYRKDLFEKNNQPLPTTWKEVLELAKAGKVAVPAIPIDLLMNFYTFCIANGEEPFRHAKEVVSKETGIRAIEMMQQLYGVVDEKMFRCNPIAVAELMSNTDDFWYCPFAYCYSNYSRKGFAHHLLHYTSPVSCNGQPLRTTIGGTGLAISAFCRDREAALDYAATIASGNWQRTLYVQHGGQPGHRSAWLDNEANWITHNFFRELLPVMDNGYLRPRYNGYLQFQDHAGDPLQQCLLQNGNPEDALHEMNIIYRKSFIQSPSMIGI